MAKTRKEVARRPSRAQRILLEHFERTYGKSNDDLEKEFSRERARFFGRKPPPENEPDFSKSTYHSWRRQDTSPTVHDVEVLSRVAQQRQTLVVDPSATTDNARDDEMSEWLDDADDLIQEMGTLTERQRGAVLNAARAAIKEERARAAPRNPQQPAEASGSSRGRLSK